MRIDLAFDVKDGNELRLPKINMHLLQAMMYKLMPEDLAGFLHDRGYEFGKRKFKLFTYSWLKGKGRPRFDDRFIYFIPPLHLTVATPISETLEGIANGSLSKRSIRLGNTDLECRSVTIVANEACGDSVTVEALSPVTCFSTLYKQDGSPFTVYHDPREAEFRQQISDNLKKKFSLIHQKEAVPEGQVSITPVGKPRLQVARFKPDDPRPIKGWWGKFRLEGPQPLLQTALDAGLGAKSSAGFGCVGIEQRERR